VLVLNSRGSWSSTCIEDGEEIVWLMVDADGQHDGGTDELNDDRFRQADAARGTATEFP
jgi:hypothetical protein